MAWLTESEFRGFHVTESATETTSAQVVECLETAKEIIASFAGESILTETSTADNTLRKTKSLRRAQRKLAFRELLEFMSSRSRDGGLIETEKDANGETTNKYVSYSEVAARRQALYTEALGIIEVYILPLEAVELTRVRSKSVPINISF